MVHWFARGLKDVQEHDGKGFTLIELLIVVIILGILVVIAVPTYLSQRDRARDAVIDSDLRTVGTAISTCLLENANTTCESDGELNTFVYQPERASNPHLRYAGRQPSDGHSHPHPRRFSHRHLRQCDWPGYLGVA
jgi:type II secretion system protein G